MSWELMTPLAWVQLVFIVVSSIAITALLFFFHTGRYIGRYQTKTEHDIKKAEDDVSDLTRKIQVEIRRFEAKGEEKADVKALVALEQRIEARLGYLERRLTEMVAHTDKRFDDGSERMSRLNGKIQEMVERVREEISSARERLGRFEERLDERTGHVNGRRESDKREPPIKI